jgi:hypothetical protein
MWQKIIQWSRFKNKQKGKEKTESRKQRFLFFVAQYCCSSSSLHHSRRSASLQLAAAISSLSVPTPLSAVTPLCQYQYLDFAWHTSAVFDLAYLCYIGFAWHTSTVAYEHMSSVYFPATCYIPNTY